VTSVAWITACTLSLISASVLGHEIAGPSGASPVVEDIVDKEECLEIVGFIYPARTVRYLE
jgi:hypothetical protein